MQFSPPATEYKRKYHIDYFYKTPHQLLVKILLSAHFTFKVRKKGKEEKEIQSLPLLCFPSKYLALPPALFNHNLLEQDLELLTLLILSFFASHISLETTR